MKSCRNTMWPTLPRPPNNSACSHTDPCSETVLRFQLPLLSLLPFSGWRSAATYFARRPHNRLFQSEFGNCTFESMGKFVFF